MESRAPWFSITDALPQHAAALGSANDPQAWYGSPPNEALQLPPDSSFQSIRGSILAVRAVGSLGIFVALVALTALFGAQFEPGPWYEGLQKPPLNPPNRVFGPVWSFLYLAIAVAGWLVWRDRPASSRPLVLWGCQLVLNAAWSLLFFGLHLPGLALVEMILLLALLIATTVSFFRIRTVAGLLFLPYVAWVGFAAYLNAGLWYLNR